VGSNPTPSACSGAKMGAVFLFGVWLSPVERCVRDTEVPGSSRGARGFGMRSPENLRAPLSSLANHLFYGVGIAVGIALV